MTIEQYDALWEGMMELTQGPGDWAWKFDVEYDGWWIERRGDNGSRRTFLTEHELLSPAYRSLFRLHFLV